MLEAIKNPHEDIWHTVRLAIKIKIGIVRGGGDEGRTIIVLGILSFGSLERGVKWPEVVVVVEERGEAAEVESQHAHGFPRSMRGRP